MTRLYPLAAFLILAGSLLAINDDLRPHDPAPTVHTEDITSGIGYYTITWPDAARAGRPVPLDLIYPINDTTGLPPAAYQFTDGNGTNYGQHPMPGIMQGGLNRIAGTHPLIVLSHGAGAAGIGYYELARDLAAHGYIVVLVTHRGDSLIDKGLGIPPDPWNVIISNRFYDLSLAVTLGDALTYSHTNGQHVAMGHSMGAVTALTLTTGLSAYHHPDARIDAVIAINPAIYLLPLFWGTGYGPACQTEPGDTATCLLESIHKPVMLIGSRMDLVVPPSVVDDVSKHLTGTPFTDRTDIAGVDHTATSSVWPLKASVDASTAPQIVKDHVAGTAAGACPDHTDSCVPTMHTLQLDAILDFLDRALP